MRHDNVNSQLTKLSMAAKSHSRKILLDIYYMTIRVSFASKMHIGNYIGARVVIKTHTVGHPALAPIC